MSQFFTSGGQSIGISASVSVLPMNIQDRDSQESSPPPQFKSINSLGSAFFVVQLSHPYMTTGKTIALTRQPFVGKVLSLLFNILSRLFIMRESIPRQVDKKSRIPEEEKRVWCSGSGDRCLEFSRRKRQTWFVCLFVFSLSLHSLVTVTEN